MTVTGYLLIAALVLWSLYRQVQVNRVTAGTLVRLPIIMTVIGIAVGGRALGRLLDADVFAYTLLSLGLSVFFGVLRGFQIRIWQDADGYLFQGTWITIVLWLVMIGSKVALGVVEGFHGGPHNPSVAEIFVFIALSAVVQNVIVALRTGLWPNRWHVGGTGAGLDASGVRR